MARCLLILALVCAALAGVRGSRSLSQVAPVPAPGPNYAPAPTSVINGATAFNCPSPGSTGYLFQPGPCNFGTYAGQSVYCDQDTEGAGVVGIRLASTTNCTSTSGCPSGSFCSAQTAYNGSCTPVADTLCFAGSLAPTPAPGGAPASAPIVAPAPSTTSALPSSDAVAPATTTAAVAPTTLSSTASAVAPAVSTSGSKRR